MSFSLKKYIVASTVVMAMATPTLAQVTSPAEQLSNDAVTAQGYYNAGSALAVQQQGDVSYVSGGVGREELEALQALQKDFNLKISNNDKAGHYSGDVHLIIKNSKNEAVLDMMGGPKIYAELPTGRYSVEAQNNSEVRKQNLTIRNGKSANINFVWSEDSY